MEASTTTTRPGDTRWTVGGLAVEVLAVRGRWAWVRREGWVPSTVTVSSLSAHPPAPDVGEAAQGAEVDRCPICGGWRFETRCPYCGAAPAAEVAP